MKEKLLQKKFLYLILGMLFFGLSYVAVQPNAVAYADEAEESQIYDEENGLYYEPYNSNYKLVGFDESRTEFIVPEKYNEKEIYIADEFSVSSQVEKLTLNCRWSSFPVVSIIDMSECSKLSYFEITRKSSPAPSLIFNSTTNLTIKLVNTGDIDMSGCTGNVSFEVSDYLSPNYTIIYPEKLVSYKFNLGGKIPDFSSFKYLKSVTIWNTYKYEQSLPRELFKNRTTLTSVSLPSGITGIGAYAFYNCKALTKLTLPSSVNWIDSYAFAYSGIKTLKIPSNCSIIYNYAFYKCSSLRQIVIPKSVNTISSNAFNSHDPFLTIVTPTGTTAAKYAEKNNIYTSTSTSFMVEAKMPKTYLGAKRYIKPLNYFGTVKFVSSNTKVATVSTSGVITPKKAGKVNITLYLGGKKYKTYSYTIYSRTQANVLNIIYSYYVTSSMTDYQKIIAADKWLVENVRYDVSKVNGGKYPYERHTAKSAFEKGLAVCDGYSYAFQTIMKHYGITCTVVTNSNHAWNQVKLGSYWYYVDVTWDDPVSLANVDGKYKYTNTNTVSTQLYLLINSAQLARDHKGPFHNGKNTKATAANYNKQIVHTGYSGAVINRATATISKGKTTTVKVTGTKKKVTYSSSNKAIATVSSKGVITGKKAGTCYINVKIGSKTYKVKVTVK